VSYEELRIGELAAWHFPATGERKTTVVMAHGFSMTMRDGLEPYGTALSEAGNEVLAFDFRHLGESGGEPRQSFRTSRQLADYRAASAYARTHLGAERVVLWGFSFAGGLAVKVAALDGGFAGLIAVCPFLDGPARIRNGDIRLMPSILTRAVADRAGRHNLIPVTAHPGTLAAMNFEGEYDGFLAARHEGSQWRNEISPGVFATAPYHRPVRFAKRLECPVWAGLGERDITVSGKAIQKLVRKAPRAELHRYDCDHFEPFYVEELAKRIAGDQAAFLAAL
jgi:pimeloyl-ACP methyl ester carboxylesterase